MPYVLGINEIHVITNDDKNNKYKHIANDKFFVIYKDTPNTEGFIGKVIKDIIDNDERPAFKVKNLCMLSHMPGVTLDVVFLDYIDRRNKSVDTETTLGWTRHYAWEHFTYSEGNSTQHEMSYYTHSRFEKAFDIDKVLTDYMTVHSAKLWEYDSSLGHYSPTHDSLVNTQRTVIQTQHNAGLLNGTVTRYQLTQQLEEELVTAAHQEPHNHQKGITF